MGFYYNWIAFSENGCLHHMRLIDLWIKSRLTYHSLKESIKQSFKYNTTTNKTLIGILSSIKWVFAKVFQSSRRNITCSFDASIHFSQNGADQWVENHFCIHTNECIDMDGYRPASLFIIIQPFFASQLNYC